MTKLMKSSRSAIMSIVVLVATSHHAAGQWTDDSFDEFRKGNFLDAGSNLYVSAAGRLQIINRWDLNNDGNLDIVMPSGHCHTEKEDTFIYLNSGQDIDGRSRILLAANGSRDGLIFDFDKDGLNDLAVANGDNGITTRTDAYVFYGTAQGLTTERRITLPAHASSSIAAGDFNGDGWTDLAIACQWDAAEIGAPAGPKCSFVYWNSPSGFHADKRTALSVDGAGAVAVAAGDLDGDRIADLVMMFGKQTYLCYAKDHSIEDPSKRIALSVAATSAAIGDVNGDQHQDLAFCVGPDAVLVVRGSSSGFAPDQPIRLEAKTPYRVVLADFDEDGLDDVAIANFSSPEGATWINSYIYYSDGKEFTSRQRSELPTMGAAAASAGDLNSDGLPEIVFSNQRVLNQQNIASCVYWNVGGEFRKENRTELDTQGSVGNAIGDVNNDGKPDVVFFNFEGNFRDGPTYSRIYWGDGARNFSPLRTTDIPSHYVTSVAHADLDDDGHVDLIFTQSRFVSGAPENLFNSVIIYWGSDAGFSTTTRLTVDYLAGGVRIADLNQDGMLDLTVGALSTDPKDPQRKGVPIFWGSPVGFTQANKTIITPAAAYPRVPLVADLNRDGYLDLASQVTFGTVTIWWGRAGDGFAEDNTSTIDLGRNDELVFLNAADLNHDGWLDLILPCRAVAGNDEVSSFVYYGSSGGFSNEDREELPSSGIYEVSAADLDKDGWLDLVFTSYQGNFRRNFPSYIYWGSKDGCLQRPRAELPSYAASGVETADYDGDGWLDILLSNHRIDGSSDKPGPHNHLTNSMLYWGGAGGFSPQQRWDFPTNGPHAMNVRDVGNSYDRGLYEDYVSAPFELPEGRHPTTLRWTAKTPSGTTVTFQLRAAENANALKEAPWQGPGGDETWYDTSGAAIESVRGSWIQYRARLHTPNGGPTPYLTSVNIDYGD